MNKPAKQPTNYTDWLEGHGSPPDALTSSLDALYAPGPGAGASGAATQAVQASLAEMTAPIFYDRLDPTPLGPIWLAAGPHGLVAIEYAVSEASFCATLAKLTPSEPQRSAAKVAAAKVQLLAYLSGQSERFSLDIDLSHLTAFQRRVLEETRKVPRGQVASYAQIAKRIGKPSASRAVGQALRRNPVPIVIPCHRVIASDGSLGGYSGEMRSRRKRQLLRLEGAAIT
ncbi:MAG TPA: methylated-DNA--[protein]-cysteine S-methyltransferase [Anaerolineales bacterium]|nr:methylated-DNA--[protein]-cysteine S-methyltransferase [Anaerolineales bacterium]